MTPRAIDVILLAGADVRAPWEEMAVGQNTVHQPPGGRFARIAGRGKGTGPGRLRPLSAALRKPRAA